MLLKVALKKLVESKDFKSFQKEHKDSFLAHCFTIIDNIQHPWQIGYYNPKNNKVVVFEVDKDITKMPEEDVFKRPESKVNALDCDSVRLNLKAALKITDNLIKEKYHSEEISKTIAILQHLETDLYNFTFVTKTLHIINIKIDASDGKVLHESMQSILGLGKQNA